jgi:hypothetical protein
MARLWRDQGKRDEAAIFSLRSTGGLLKDLICGISKKPERCSTSYRREIGSKHSISGSTRSRLPRTTPALSCLI